MAASGSFSKVFSTGYTLKIAWSESNVDTANNQSDITVTAYLIASGSYHINSTASKKITLTINGTPYSGTCTVGISGGETLKLYSATVSNINHNSDGSKSISIACTLNIAVTLSGSYVSSVSASGTAALTTIARKSTLSASNGTLGTAQDLTVSRKDSGFTHTITYKCGSTSGTVCTKSSSTTISFTPPLSLASQNTTGTTVSIVFTITTYNSSGTSLGSNTKTITCSIPSTVVPTASFTVEDALGYLATYGGYIQNKSQFAIKVTANGVYSSTIKSYKVVANGKTYTTASVTTGAITSSGTLKITVTVTDSRGRTATVSKKVTVLAYSSPKISSLAVKRTNSSGVASSSGEYLTATFKATVSSLNNKNTVTYVLKYKKKSETEYTSVALTAIEDNYSVTYSTIFEAEKDSSYDVIIVATDAFDSIKKSGTGAPVNKTFSFFKKGMGVAFGKIAELAGYVDIGWKIIFRQHLYMDNYSDEEKMFYFQNDSSRQGKTYENDGLRPHNCRIYGGSASSTTGIGFFDEANNRHIWVYDDVNNIIKSGATLQSTPITVTIDSTNATEVTYSAKAFPFLGITVFQGRFTLKDVADKETLILGTLQTGYAPATCLTPLTTWINSSVGTCNVSGHITTDGVIKFHYRNDVDGTTLTAGKYIYVSGVWTY